MYKKIIIVFMLFIVSLNAFSFSPLKEKIIIRNFSSKDLLLIREYRNDPDKKFYAEETKSWRQIIHGLDVDFTDILLERREIRIRPNQEIVILNYEPIGPDRWLRLSQISFLDKITVIYQFFTIEYNGYSIITLENFNDQLLKIYATNNLIGIWNIIEIFDIDLIEVP